MNTPTVTSISPRPNRAIFFLPWLRLCNKSHNRQSFQLAHAIVLRDDNETWSSLLKLPRPSWLEIFRELPLQGRTKGEPARGTLIVCDTHDDDRWVAEHIDRFMGILFVLATDRGRWRTPSEAFRHYKFVGREQPSEDVQFQSKTSTYFEHKKHFAIYPGLELRGAERNVALEFDSGWQKELVDRFVTNPHDRIATACYHLMRAQFQDLFTSSAEQDFASCCASIEASLDISEQDCATKMQDGLEKILFPSEKLRRWASGSMQFGRSTIMVLSPTRSIIPMIDELRMQGIFAADLAVGISLAVLHYSASCLHAFPQQVMEISFDFRLSRKNQSIVFFDLIIDGPNSRSISRAQVMLIALLVSGERIALHL